MRSHVQRLKRLSRSWLLADHGFWTRYSEWCIVQMFWRLTLTGVNGIRMFPSTCAFRRSAPPDRPPPPAACGPPTPPAGGRVLHPLAAPPGGARLRLPDGAAAARRGAAGDGGSGGGGGGAAGTPAGGAAVVVGGRRESGGRSGEGGRLPPRSSRGRSGGTAPVRDSLALMPKALGGGRDGRLQRAAANGGRGQTPCRRPLQRRAGGAVIADWSSAGQCLGGL